MDIFGFYLDPFELFGTIFGIIGVWLTIKENILCFPVGIVNVGLYAWLFASAKLYADSALQVIYIALLIYGWYNWIHGKKKDEELPVTGFQLRQWIPILFIGLLLFLSIRFILINYTDGHLPNWDSLTMGMSLIAQWMIAKKKVENWIIWIIADIIYVGMYIYKDLYLTAFLYSIFIILAVVGYMDWRSKMKTINTAWASE